MELYRVFDPLQPKKEASCKLPLLSQGNRSVDQYAVEFRTIAADSSCNDAALYDTFYHGLAERIKDERAARDLPTSLNGLIDLAACINRRFHDRQRERGVRSQ